MSGLERRFNLIVYLSPHWQPGWGGALEMRGAAPAPAPGMQGVGAAALGTTELPGEVSARVVPAFNRAVLFSTTAPSYHGFPEPLTCPAGVSRNSLALYYLTPPRARARRRSKALYVPTPGAPDSPELQRLRELRSQRRLEPSDLGGDHRATRPTRAPGGP